MNQHKNSVQLQAEMTFIGELQVFRRNNKPDFSKKMVDLKTNDGQRLFCEVRNSKIPLLNDLSIGDIVTVELLFAGSEKNGKKYNNLYIVNIEKA